jgi:hypothetical protein
MNGYICFYESDRVEVYANTLYEAKEKALKLFAIKYPRRKIKSYMTSAHLAEKNGQQVTHIPDF